MHVDHDNYKASIGQFKVFDNTMYPRTLNPCKNYGLDEPIAAQEILSVVDNSNEDTVLFFEMVSFHFPLDFCCPL